VTCLFRVTKDCLDASLISFSGIVSERHREGYRRRWGKLLRVPGHVWGESDPAWVLAHTHTVTMELDGADCQVVSWCRIVNAVVCVYSLCPRTFEQSEMSRFTFH
jgi:hypothetical protein